MIFGCVYNFLYPVMTPSVSSWFCQEQVCNRIPPSNPGEYSCFHATVAADLVHIAGDIFPFSNDAIQLPKKKKKEYKQIKMACGNDKG